MTAESRSTAPQNRVIAQLLLASRPLSWINTAFPFAAAYFLTTGEVDTRLVVGTVFFLIPYNLAMYGINDVFDYQSDLANPRKGGAQGAVLSPSIHRLTVLSSLLLSLPFVIVLVTLGGPPSWLALAISLFAVAAYSVPGLRFKEKPFLDSVTSSIHFVSPAVYGLLLAEANFTPPVVVVLAAFFLWGVASHAFGAVQDVMPDRDAGISSIATVMGAQWTVRFAIGSWALGGALMLWTGWPVPLAALLVIPYIALALPYAFVSDEGSTEANRGWARFLWLNYGAGFLITMLMIWYTFGRNHPT